MKAYVNLVAIICAGLVSQVACADPLFDPKTDPKGALLFHVNALTRPNQDPVQAGLEAYRRTNALLFHAKDFELPNFFSLKDYITYVDLRPKCSIDDLKAHLTLCDSLKEDPELAGRARTLCRQKIPESVEYCLRNFDHISNQDDAWTMSEFPQHLEEAVKKSNGQYQASGPKVQFNNKHTSLEEFINQL